MADFWSLRFDTCKHNDNKMMNCSACKFSINDPNN